MLDRALTRVREDSRLCALLRNVIVAHGDVCRTSDDVRTPILRQRGVPTVFLVMAHRVLSNVEKNHRAWHLKT